MIHRAKFQNFKALRDIEVSFDSRLTVLVGPNGSGKTSVLKGIELISLLARGVPHARIIHDICNQDHCYGGNGIDPLVVSVDVNGPARTFACRLMITPQTPPDATEKTSFSGDWRVIESTGGSQRETVNPGKLESETLRWTALLKLSPDDIARPSEMGKLPPTIDTNGAGVASVLAYYDRTDRARLEQIVTNLRVVIPNLEVVRPAYTATPNGIRDTFHFDFRGARDVKANAASSGTLIALGLVTMIHGPNSPRVMLLDDLDRDLHPKAQMQLIELLRSLLAQYPSLQIIATSHSP